MEVHVPMYCLGLLGATLCAVYTVNISPFCHFTEKLMYRAHTWAHLHCGRAFCPNALYKGKEENKPSCPMPMYDLASGHHSCTIKICSVL